jgi:hypothetical protein
MHAARWPEHAAKQKPEASRLRGMYDSEQDIHAARDAWNNTLKRATAMKRAASQSTPGAMLADLLPSGL